MVNKNSSGTLWTFSIQKKDTKKVLGGKIRTCRGLLTFSEAMDD